MSGTRVPDEPDGPMAVRMLVGAQLRRLREQAGLSRAEAGYHIRASDSKISRMELGRVRFKRRDVRDLLTLYGVRDEAERTALLARVQEANAPTWWHPYTDVTPEWFQRYLGLEATATLIRTYEVQFILAAADRGVRPGGGTPGAAAPARRRWSAGAVRMERQQLLRRGRADLWAVVDETALRRPVGGAG